MSPFADVPMVPGVSDVSPLTLLVMRSPALLLFDVWLRGAGIVFGGFDTTWLGDIVQPFFDATPPSHLFYVITCRKW